MSQEVLFTQVFREHAKEIFDFIAIDSQQNAYSFSNNLLQEIEVIITKSSANPPITNFPNQLHRYRFRIF